MRCCTYTYRLRSTHVSIDPRARAELACARARTHAENRVYFNDAAVLSGTFVRTCAIHVQHETALARGAFSARVFRSISPPLSPHVRLTLVHACCAAMERARTNAHPGEIRRLKKLIASRRPAIESRGKIRPIGRYR